MLRLQNFKPPRNKLSENVFSAIDYTGDPNFANVSLLLPFDGTDGDTTTTDASNNAHTITMVGDAQIDDGQAKFGTSLLLDGTGDYVTVPNSNTFNFSADFSIEFWGRPTTGGLAIGFGDNGLLNQNGGGWYLDSTGQFVIGNGSANDTISGLSYTTNTWVFYQIIRSGTTITLYKNGSSAGSGTSSKVTAYNNSVLVVGGRRTGASGVGSISDLTTGNIDDLRITKGVARPNTVPTEAFPTK